MQGAFSTQEVETAKDINYWAKFYCEWSVSLIILFPLLFIISPLVLLFSIYRLVQLKRLRSGNSEVMEVESRYKDLLPMELKRELGGRADLLAVAKLRTSYFHLLTTTALSGGVLLLFVWFAWWIGYDNVVDMVRAVVSGYRDARDA